MFGKIRAFLSVQESELSTTALVLNPHAQPYTGPVRHNGEYFDTENLAAASLTRATLRPYSFTQTDETALENDTLKVTIDCTDGSITSAFDKEYGIEYCGEALNRLNTYEDRPITPGKSAWLLEAYHRLEREEHRPEGGK